MMGNGSIQGTVNGSTMTVHMAVPTGGFSVVWRDPSETVRYWIGDHRVWTEDPLEGTALRFGRFVTGIAAVCAAVVMSGMPGVAGQMPQAPPPATSAKAKPNPDPATTSEARTAAQDSMTAHTDPQHGAEAPMPQDMSTMAMDPYFAALNYPVPQDTMMVMLLSDFQSARTTNDFVTAMGMVQYGLTTRWTVGFMVEGQKISGSPATYGGLRINSSFRVFPHDHLLNFTVYGEYEGLNGAALYKMEVAGFGGGDLNEPLASARRTPVRTVELRAIVYHDWGRVNVTFNFINETGLDSGENDFGYTWGVFRQPAYNGMETNTDMAGMAGMAKKEAPPMFSLQRLGYGLEMMGALGNTHQFGFDWQRQQQYVGPVFSYTISKHWTARVEAACGLSNVSDPFMLRMGVGYSIDHLLHRRSPTP
jgi:hypothetical protein